MLAPTISSKSEALCTILKITSSSMSSPEEIIRLAILGCEVDLITAGAIPVADKRKAAIQAIQTYMVERDVAAARVVATAAAKAKEPVITAAVNALLPSRWWQAWL